MGMSASRHAEQRARERRRLQMGLVLLDAAMLLLAVLVAGLARIGLEQVGPVLSLGFPERHATASVLALPALLLLFRLQGLYDLDHILVGTREYAKIANGVAYGVLAVLAISYFGGSGPLVSRSWLVLMWVLGIACVAMGRFAVRRVVRHLRKDGSLRTRVVVVGASSLGVAVAEQLAAAQDEGIDVIGVVDEYLPLGQEVLPGASVIGRPADLLAGDNTLSLPGAATGDAAGAGESSVTGDVDEYILVTQALPYERLESLTRQMASWSGPPLRVVVSSTDLLTHGVVLSERGAVALATLGCARITGIDAALKRLLDIAGALVGCLLLAPPVLGAVVWASVTRRAPVVHRFHVFGSGRPVTLRLLDPAVAPRLPVRGAPALLSVITGQLSLVGPRPVLCGPGEPTQQSLWLTAVKPGLTGAWRLGGPDASLQDQAVRDLTYVRNYSIWEDLRILWRSIQVVAGNSLSPVLARWQTHASALGSGSSGAARALTPEAV